MAPIKRLTQKEKGLIERPVITSGILKSIQSRDKCFEEFTKETNKNIKTTKYDIFKRKRNLITSLTRLSKKKYYSDYFLEHQSNIKRTWDGIRDLLNVNKKSKCSIDKLAENSIHISDHLEMANTMNNFFVGIRKSVEEKIPCVNKSFSEYMSDQNSFSIFLNPCTPAEIKKVNRQIECF